MRSSPANPRALTPNRIKLLNELMVLAVRSGEITNEMEIEFKSDTRKLESFFTGGFDISELELEEMLKQQNETKL
jgi:hypothetical protein